MLSKKYYCAFAELLKTSTDLADFKQLLEDYLAIDNSRFDRARFRKASTRQELSYIEAHAQAQKETANAQA